MDNRLKLYQIALECLGKDMAPYEDEFGCAEAVNAVFKKAFGRDIGGGQSTYWLYDILKHDIRFEKNYSPLPGDIIISPTGYGNKKKLRNGHVGIVAESEQIMSNNSINGLWEKNYTLVTWARRYKIFGGYPVEFFRVKTPQLAPTAPTIPATAYTSPNIVVNPPLVSMPAWMSNFLHRQTQKLGMIFGDRTFGAARSSGWSVLQKETIKLHPYCAFHGGKGKILNPLNVHHVRPFHEHPELELERSNLLVACRFCHFWFCHFGNWKNSNPTAREDAALWIEKIEN